MVLTKDFSQCQDCVFYKINQGIATCNYSGKGTILDNKLEECPDYASRDEAAQLVLDKRECLKKITKEEQERLEKEKREKEEYERAHPKEFWILRYKWSCPLKYEILFYCGCHPLYPVDNNTIHWDGEDDDEIICYCSTEEKAYQRYKEVLEEYIKDDEAELLEMRERLTYLKAHGLIK